MKIADGMNAKNHPEKVVGEKINDVYTIEQLQEHVIIKLTGHKTAREYEIDSSCTHRLKDIKIPYFFLASSDDPIMGSKVIPIAHCHENILLAVTKYGGHVCYFEGTFLPTSCWYPKPVLEFLNYFAKEE